MCKQVEKLFLEIFRGFSMKFTLTEAQKASYFRNGYLVVEGLVSDDQIERLKHQSELIGDNKVDHVPNSSTQVEPDIDIKLCSEKNLTLRKLYDIAVYDQTFWKHVINEKIVDVVSQLLETNDIKLYGDQLFMKNPEVGSEIYWHQDSASWKDIFPKDLITAWTALDNATLENGCLKFIPGSHRFGTLGLDCDSREGKMEKFLPLLNFNQWKIQDIELTPGSVSFHHSLLVHGSGRNLSSSRRRGYAAHYMRALSWKDDRITDAPKMPKFCQVRGKSYENCV